MKDNLRRLLMKKEELNIYQSIIRVNPTMKNQPWISMISAPYQRFISRRGLCTVIYSDNTRTFKRAEIELRRLWTIINHPDVKKFCASRGVKWKYIIERGAWWGGFYERIVRSVKTILRKVIGKSFLTSEELETILCEIEAVINSRPITYIDSDSTGNFPLTPSHFLLERR
ncbi:integrase catalytic domain-containing protein [Trichonephila clavata]|uniref:Integrase catalytic domain-containing protein n=1 Tax=Trichonephila clavata TaxID=2740835 RepID=A0A8X6HAH7_TRICU|nr:integrase catalytic domain-containing protein [Trichonephila clavata]